ncbi:MAG: cytochrome c3 family protein [Thermoanaerobaculia bacterium]|nr:cytochrome c3 family protein [Thermoanaerobaculia bacterium]
MNARRLAALPIVALLAVVRPAAAELPPGQAVDQLRVCLDCHDLAEPLRAKVQHPPAAGGDCASCHNPHVSRFDKLLLERPGPLCASCHDGLTAELGRRVVHAPVVEGRCADCHAPHGSAFAGLLSRPAGELCQSCHADVADWKKREVAHAPFAQGRCGTCHEPHASDVAGLLKSGAACTSCHAVDARFRSLHGGYPVEKAPCATCHDPHASDRKGLLRETVHEPFASGDCATCHVGSRAAQPFALVKPQDELCGDCHAEQVAASRDARFPHVSGGGGACTACHNPHAGEGQAMLLRKGDATCLSCHDPGGASSGQPGRFAQHAGEVSCTTCHAPHGAERPRLFVKDPLQICGDCHSHQHGVSHPMGEGKLDPRSGATMDCGSCHALHEAPYPKYLHAGEATDLCVSCHKGMARRNR